MVKIGGQTVIGIDTLDLKESVEVKAAGSMSALHDGSLAFM